MVIVPVGETRVALDGTDTDTMKSILSLQGPEPAEFQVSIHQEAFPFARGVVGVTVQVPVPLSQLAWAAVYHC